MMIMNPEAGAAANRRRHHHHHQAPSSLLAGLLFLILLHCWNHDKILVLGFSVSMSSDSSNVVDKSSSSNNNNNNFMIMKSRRDVLLESSTKVVASSAFVFGTTGTAFPLSCRASYIDPITDMPKVTSRVYLDVEIGDTTSSNKSEDSNAARLVIGLFGQEMPRTTSIFESYCRDNAYANTIFYRIISNTTIQGGAMGDVTGKTSPNSISFEPDNYNIKHTVPGLVSTVRRGIGGSGIDSGGSGGGGSADSRFFINTSADAGWADDRYAAFGIVLDGMDFVTQQIQKVNVKPPQNRPIVDVKIVKSGVL